MKRALIAAALLASTQAQAAQVTFLWDQLDKTGVAGYTLGCGPTSGNHATVNDVPGANTLTKTLTLAPGQYFCAVWAYSTPSSLVSAKSNELVVLVPPSAPSNFRMTLSFVWDAIEQKYALYASDIQE